MKSTPFDQARSLCAANNSLYSVEIDITNSCNCNCIFCFEGEDHAKRGELSLKEYSDLLFELREMGCHYIGFSGGEPFMRSDWFDLFSLAKDYGFRCSVITNGAFVTETTLNQLKRIGFDRISFSLHSLDKTTNSRIFGNSSMSPNHTIAMIKYGLSIGLNVGVCMTLTKYNIDDADNFVNYFLKLGVPREKISLNRLVRGKKSITEIGPSLEQFLKKKSILRHETNGKKDTGATTFLCSAGKITCTISSNGDVYPCGFLNCSAGNIKNQKISDIWNGSDLFKIIRSFSEKHFSKCLSCKSSPVCNVCFADNLHATGNVFAPDQARCAIELGRNDD